MHTRRLTAVLAAGVVLLGAAAPVWADDVDGDGVNDFFDVCDNTPTGTAVDAEGRPLGDLDQDCDVDLDDFAVFAEQITGPLAPYVVVDTVLVGNPGNAGEWSGVNYGGFGPDRICGAVDHIYNIGKFEVTAGQYSEFLNAVASEDTYGLYRTTMMTMRANTHATMRDGTFGYGCKIERTGSSPNYRYSVAPDWADRPVNYVSWGDAARFANWLHNGQPTGAQNLSTTEDGSYYLDGATSDAELLAITREPDATWVIPSEDEWYKAAYHYNDGATGNYYDYPTNSDTVPGYVNDSGNLSATGTPFAEGGTDPGNYATHNGDEGGPGPGIGSPYYRTEVGEWEDSDSPYGTSDQGGNVWEWSEAILYGSYRGFRGGSFIDGGNLLHAAYRIHSAFGHPTYEGHGVGFRIAEVP